MLMSTREYIETAAYYFWLNDGKPEGKDKEHWDKAENISLPSMNGEGFIPLKKIKTVEIRNLILDDILDILGRNMCYEIDREIERTIFGFKKQ